MDEKQFKLKKVLKELGSIKGRHTELVSVYIPKGYSISDVANQLKNEQGTAINIKSKGTKKNVLSALEKIIQHLKLYKQTPPNGLIMFSGNISQQEGVSDIKIWAIEPPETLTTKLYWCDQRFDLGPLQDMVKEKEVFGLIVLDSKEATIGVLKGKSIRVMKRMDSIVPGKFIKGGQSAQRFERVREGLINDFLKQIADSAKAVFPKEIKGILIGGPGPIKNEFHDQHHLLTSLQDKVLGVKDIGYTDEYGLHELVTRSEDLLSEAAVSKEKKLVNRFFEELHKGSGMVTYGLKSVLNVLERGAVDIILISEDTEYVEGEFQCGCGFSYKNFLKSNQLNYHICPKCNQKMGVIGERDIIEALEETAKMFGTKVEIISRETREGEQLFQTGGIAAILRYKL